MNMIKTLRTPAGIIVLSIILGLGLASLFRRTCKGEDCIQFKAPPLEKLSDKVFRRDQSCYRLSEKSVVCDASKKTFDFDSV